MLDFKKLFRVIKTTQLGKYCIVAIKFLLELIKNLLPYAVCTTINLLIYNVAEWDCVLGNKPCVWDAVTLSVIEICTILLIYGVIILLKIVYKHVNSYCIDLYKEIYNKYNDMVPLNEANEMINTV
jgi:hypothetical protein